jgi:hypothetical protein
MQRDESGQAASQHRTTDEAARIAAISSIGFTLIQRTLTTANWTLNNPSVEIEFIGL